MYLHRYRRISKSCIICWKSKAITDACAAMASIIAAVEARIENGPCPAAMMLWVWPLALIWLFEPVNPVRIGFGQFIINVQGTFLRPQKEARWLNEGNRNGNSVQVLRALLRRRTHRPMAKKLSGSLLALQRARLWSAADEPKDRSRQP
jgi:hypothetical protein